MYKRQAQQLASTAPDIVYVGLGSPKQEEVIDRLRDTLPHAWFMGVGIAFSFVAGKIRRAPDVYKRQELVLIGDGPMRSEIEHRIHDLQLQDCITLSGAASTAAMIGIIQSSRALVLPSFAENLPSVIMEVFALARPVIATYVGGIPELVEPGISGWLVPAGNLDALVDAMRQVLAAPVSRLEEMGLHGAQRVRSENRFEMTASRLLAKFRNADDIP